MSKHIEDDETKNIFKNASSKILESLIDNYANYNNDNADGLLLGVTHCKPDGKGLNECAVYGDYFYLEAMARYTIDDFKMFW